YRRARHRGPPRVASFSVEQAADLVYWRWPHCWSRTACWRRRQTPIAHRRLIPLLPTRAHTTTPHSAPPPRKVISLCMPGGPSHVDLFDPKPDLIRLAGQPIPESFGMFKTRRNVAKNKLFPPIRPFRKRGQCGMEVSDLLPHMAG